MKKGLLFLILVLLFLVSSSFAFAVPVTYKGFIEYNNTDSINSLKAVSDRRITLKNITQSQYKTPFVLNHVANEGVMVEFIFQDLVVRKIKQSKPGTVIDLGVILVGSVDSDKDGIRDEEDNCIYVPNFNQSDNNKNGIGDACENDSDGDNIEDSRDSLIGNENHITTNIIGLDLLIGNDTNTSKEFVGKKEVIFKKGSEKIVEFNFNFSKSKLSLANVSIKKNNGTEIYGSLLISGIDLSLQGERKTVYVDRISNEDYICLIDKDVVSINELPSNECQKEGEIAVPCSNEGSSALGYNCTIIGDKFKVEGLKHSGVRESTYKLSSDSSSLNEVGSSGGKDNSKKYSNDPLNILDKAKEALDIILPTPENNDNRDKDNEIIKKQKEEGFITVKDKDYEKKERKKDKGIMSITGKAIEILGDYSESHLLEVLSLLLFFIVTTDFIFIHPRRGRIVKLYIKRILFRKKIF